MSAVHLWLSQNGLVINPDKSEAVLFSTVQSNAVSQFPLTSIDVAGSAVPLTDSLKLLGVTLRLVSMCRMFAGRHSITSGR